MQLLPRCRPIWEEDEVDAKVADTLALSVGTLTVGLGTEITTTTQVADAPTAERGLDGYYTRPNGSCPTVRPRGTTTTCVTGESTRSTLVSGSPPWPRSASRTSSRSRQFNTSGRGATRMRQPWRGCRVLSES